MTKRDFELIAANFAATEALVIDFSPAVMAALRITAEKMADDIAKAHPRFNRASFIAACFPLDALAMKNRILAKLAESD